MKNVQSSYRKPIWKPNPSYDLSTVDLTPSNLTVIYELMSVNAAKMNVAVAGFQSYLNIATAIDLLPDDALYADEAGLYAYLCDATQEHGIGIPTAVCMLATRKDGRYPPCDRFIVSGLRARGDIDEIEEKILLGSNCKTFSRIYVARLVPVWTLDTRDAPRSRQTSSGEICLCS